MLTSLGFHTFEIYRRLTYGMAMMILKAFKNYDKVIVRPADENYKTKNTYPKGYIINYTEDDTGITWYMRFSEKYAKVMSAYESDNFESMPYSIRAKINPKFFVGIKDYLSAANADVLSAVEIRFNEEVTRISPILGTFNEYSMGRTDFCLNFDTNELQLGCSGEQLISLLKQGNIPKHFTEWKKYNDKSHRKEADKNAFYLKSKTTVINCYWKYGQLLEEYDNCRDLEKSRNLIRFEVQCLYPKVYSLAKKERFNSTIYKSMSANDLIYDHIYGQPVTNPIDILLSDTLAYEMVNKYYRRIIGNGDYYTLDEARKRILSLECRQKVKDRLIRTITFVNSCRGVAAAKAKLHEDKLGDFKRSLKELGRANINPVTVPREWSLPQIKNPLDVYIDRVVTDKQKILDEQTNKELLDYM